MQFNISKKKLCKFLLASVLVSPLVVHAGGIVVGGTRLIYPYGKKEIDVTVSNTSDKSSFLVQSWVENNTGGKSSDFIVLPPLYVSAPQNENTERVMYVGKPLPKDKESLSYFNVKAVPSMDKNKVETKNLLLVSAITKIKLFYRPDGLTPSISEAPSKLSFQKEGNKILMKNPTPYYITAVHLKVDGHEVKDTMVAPFSSATLPYSGTGGRNVSYQTINDYGALTLEIHSLVQ